MKLFELIGDLRNYNTYCWECKRRKEKKCSFKEFLKAKGEEK